MLSEHALSAMAFRLTEDQSQQSKHSQSSHQKDAKARNAGGHANNHDSSTKDREGAAPGSHVRSTGERSEHSDSGKDVQRFNIDTRPGVVGSPHGKALSPSTSRMVCTCSMHMYVCMYVYLCVQSRNEHRKVLRERHQEVTRAHAGIHVYMIYIHIYIYHIYIYIYDITYMCGCVDIWRRRNQYVMHNVCAAHTKRHVTTCAQRLD
jgi:hypothetical protein